MRQPFFAVLMIGSMMIGSMMIGSMMIGSMMVGATARAQSAGGKEATTSSATVSAEEREKAKKRLYPGGRDEEPLQVQAQLANPTRGQMAEPAEPSTDHD